MAKRIARFCYWGVSKFSFFAIYTHRSSSKKTIFYQLFLMSNRIIFLLEMSANLWLFYFSCGKNDFNGVLYFLLKCNEIIWIFTKKHIAFKAVFMNVTIKTGQFLICGKIFFIKLSICSLWAQRNNWNIYVLCGTTASDFRLN